jgi:SPP1 family predicted phage head-tail adaptor
MRAGSLRHRIQLQARTSGQSGGGEIVATYATMATVHASIEPISARDFVRGAQVQGLVSHVIRCRWTRQFTPDQTSRVLFGQRVFNIVSVRDVTERQRELEIMAMEANP